MNNMRIFLLCLFVSLCALTYCQTKEERVIKDLEELSDQLEVNKETTTDICWKEVFAKYKQIHKEAKECEFSQEQLREFGRAEGKLTTILTKEGARKMSKKIKGFARNGKYVIK